MAKAVKILIVLILTCFGCNSGDRSVGLTNEKGSVDRYYLILETEEELIESAFTEIKSYLIELENNSYNISQITIQGKQPSKILLIRTFDSEDSCKTFYDRMSNHIQSNLVRLHFYISQSDYRHLIKGGTREYKELLKK